MGVAHWWFSFYEVTCKLEVMREEERDPPHQHAFYNHVCIFHIKREEERDLYEIVQSLEIGKGVKYGASSKQEIFSLSQNRRIDELVEAFITTVFRTKSTYALQ